MTVHSTTARLLPALGLLAACGGGGDGPTPPAPVSSIVVAPDTAYVRLGTTHQLDASPRAADGTVLAGARLAWASTDTAVATVSPAGLVTARGYGTTSVTATADGVTGRAYVRVTGTPGLRIVAGGTGSDTVNATLAQPLVVELRDSQGLPVAGVRVEFVSGMVTAFPCTPVRFTGCGASHIGAYVSGDFFGLPPTDATGRVAVRPSFGFFAGSVSLVVSAPTLGLADTARYTILPGAAARIAILPKDTALYAGARYAVRTLITDRSGNPRDDPSSVSLSGSAAALEGTTVRGVAFGRARLVATSGARADTAFVSVVPRGTIAAYAHPWSSEDSTALYTFNLDGSDFRELRRTIHGRRHSEMPPAWLGPTRLVYHDGSDDGRKQLYVHDLATGAGGRFLPAGQQMDVEFLPSTSRDGAWVYFAGGTWEEHAVYRARADGTGRERLTPGTSDRQWAAHPSTDGTRIAYLSALRNHASSDIDVMDLATRQVRRLGIQGGSPRWSPDGTQIAYIAHESTPDAPWGGPTLVSANGQGARAAAPNTLATTAFLFYTAIDWSPDGRYLVGSLSDGRLTIVEVATGLEVPVTYSILGGRRLGSPAWKP